VTDLRQVTLPPSGASAFVPLHTGDVDADNTCLAPAFNGVLFGTDRERALPCAAPVDTW